MTIKATPTPGVVLWHPARRAYLRAPGSGFTRRLSRAAVMSAAQAALLMRDRSAGPFWAEPVIAPHNYSPPIQRDTLAGLSDEELLRRALRSLRLGKRSKAPQWSVVMDALGLTSGAAIQLCNRLQIDPKERTGH